MKITKNELKSIVKECLVEILSEGVGNSFSSLNESSRKSSQNFKSSKTSSFAKQRVASSALKEAIRLESGGNDIMASILADTAQKSLPTMLESDSTKFVPAPTGTVEKIVASATPEDLFGEEISSRWANLAFDNVLKK